MGYRDKAVLAPLEINLSDIEGFDGSNSIQESAKLTWLEEHLLIPIDQAGFAENQEEYEAAYDLVFEAFDELEENLETNRYLMGERITPVDIRLYSVLVRFDSIFYFAYRLNKHKVQDYKNLFRYARELYHIAPFHEATDLQGIKKAYYEAQTEIQNPYHLIMEGPDLSAWETAGDTEQ